MNAAVTAYDKRAVTDSYLIEAMSPAPLAEMIVTLRNCPQFGAALVLGSGGVLTELVGDATTLLLPAAQDDIAGALKSLKVFRLLEGFRGRPSADIDMVVAALNDLCDAFLQAREKVSEIEINPMFVYADHLVAVDALIHENCA